MFSVCFSVTYYYRDAGRRSFAHSCVTVCVPFFCWREWQNIDGRVLVWTSGKKYYSVYIWWLTCIYYTRPCRSRRQPVYSVFSIFSLCILNAAPVHSCVRQLLENDVIPLLGLMISCQADPVLGAAPSDQPLAPYYTIWNTLCICARMLRDGRAYITPREYVIARTQ